MQTPYELFKENFVKSIHSNIFLEPVVKIYPLQTGGGKSHYQDTEMPVDLKEAFPELKYIIRLSPTREVSDDGTFKKVKQLGKFRYLSDPGSEVLDVTEELATKLPEDQSPLSRTKLPAPTKDVVEA